jgi:hypothetical protein
LLDVRVTASSLRGAVKTDLSLGCGMNLSVLKGLLKEVQERIEHALPWMRPFDVEMTNPLPRESRSKLTGTSCKVTFDIQPELYALLQHRLPEGVTLKGIFWVDDVPMDPLNNSQDKKEKKQKEVTPFGAFWHELDARTFHNRTDVRARTEYQGRNDEEAKDAVRGIFGVERRSYSISPELLIGTMEEAGGLNGAVEVARATWDKVKAKATS